MRPLNYTAADPYVSEFRPAERLCAEWKTHSSIIIGVDFDDTIYDCHSNGFVFPYTISTIKRAQELGAKLCVWTANRDKELVERTWNELGLKYDYYNESPIVFHKNQVKPYFNLLLDDRAGLESALRTLNKAMVLYNNYLWSIHDTNTTSTQH